MVQTGSVTLTFTPSEDPGTSFALSDITQTVSGSGVTAGTLSNLTGTGTQRQVTYTPNSTDVGGTVTFSVADGSSPMPPAITTPMVVTPTTASPSLSIPLHQVHRVPSTPPTMSGRPALPARGHCPCSGAVQDGDVGLYSAAAMAV